MRRPSIAETVHALERDGWGERVPDPTHGRATLVRMTAAERELVCGGALKRPRDGGCLRGTSQERFEQACRPLQELLDALDPQVTARSYGRDAAGRKQAAKRRGRLTLPFQATRRGHKTDTSETTRATSRDARRSAKERDLQQEVRHKWPRVYARDAPKPQW